MTFIQIAGSSNNIDGGIPILKNKFALNLISILLFWAFYVFIDNYQFLWDYGLAKKGYIKEKGWMEKLYISLFTQIGAPPSEIAPHGTWTYMLLMLQGMATLWINTR